MILWPYQRQLLIDIYAGDVVSYTYRPSNIANVLYDMIHVKKVACVVKRRVGDDPREYEFMALTDLGRQMAEQMTQGRLL